MEDDLLTMMAEADEEMKRLANSYEFVSIAVRNILAASSAWSAGCEHQKGTLL